MKSKSNATVAKSKPATGKLGRAVAIKKAGDMSGPFTLTPAARAAKTPAALGLRQDSARWALMKYVFAHAAEKIERDDLTRITGKQTAQALTGCVRYRFLAKV